jgi:RND family efflux transporter MFP subunit
VGVDEVQRESLSQTVPVIGRLVSLQSGVVAARTSGLVKELPVEVGDVVQQGDIIAVLDKALLRAAKAVQEAELQEFQAQLASAKADAKLARLQLERMEKLRNSAAFNQSLYDTELQELETARSREQEMDARIMGGRVKLLLAETELGYGSIRAPFDGTVTLLHSNMGAWLNRGDPVITLINDGSLEIEADVSALYLQGLTPEVNVSVLLEDGSRHRARLRAIIPNENPAARTRPVRFVPEFGPMEMQLAINQPITLLLPAGSESEIVSVHKDAVLRKGGQATVYVIENGVAQPRPVQLGEAVGNRFQVLEGLAPGDIVVIRGNERLRPGQKVSYPGAPAAATEQPG